VRHRLSKKGGEEGEKVSGAVPPPEKRGGPGLMWAEKRGGKEKVWKFV